MVLIVRCHVAGERRGPCRDRGRGAGGRRDCGGAAWRMVARHAESMTREVPSQSFRLELQFVKRNIEFHFG